MEKSTSHRQLDRNIPAPLYEQLKARLNAEAREMRNEPRAATTDAALMKRFGVSRATVRNAIADLVREGVAKRVPGVGTFLNLAPRHSVGLDGFERFVQEWNLSSLDPGTRILTFRRMRADAGVAAELQLERGAPVLFVRRLRTAGGEPATLDVRYVAGWCAGQITREAAAHDMLIDILAAKAGVRAVAVEQDVGAQAADETAASILGVEPGSALLSRRVRFFAANDRPIVVGSGLYRSDRFSFHLRAER